MGVVVDEGLFDEHVEIGEGDAERAAGEGLTGEIGGDFAGDVGDEALVTVVEDVLFAAGEHEIGEGLADGVGDLGQVEALRAVRADDLDFGDGDLGVENVAPVVVRLLVLGGDRVFLESEVRLDRGGVAHGKEVGLEAGAGGVWGGAWDRKGRRGGR